MSRFAVALRHKYHVLKYPFGAAFAWLAVVIGLIAGCIEISNAVTASVTVREWVLSLALSAIALIAIVTLGFREFSRSKAGRLAKSLPYLTKTSEQLRDLRGYLNVHRENAFNDKTRADEILERARMMISELLSMQADAYSTMTGTNCRSCVKMIEVVNQDAGSTFTREDLYVFTLARDGRSEQLNRQHDEKRNKEKQDKLSENSDFLQLWDESAPDPGYFHSNDLMQDKNYESSSLKYWTTLGRQGLKHNTENWRLPYRSTIVWPIRQDVRKHLGINDFRVLGFLAVDSQATNAFERDLHVDLGTVLANALFPILEIYNNIATESQTKSRS